MTTPNPNTVATIETTAAPSATDTPGQEPADQLPEWVRKQISEANAEAANYRVKLREAESALSKAKTPEDFEAATAALKEQNVELERKVLISTVATKHQLPAELAELLRGETEAELAEHAKRLQKYAAPAVPPELGGGLNPLDTDSEPSDPGELARKYGRGRRPRP
ncbi:hypothetical protein [Kribbella deserti]|uniref:Scaffolding protein n=1 Tax=Kribbella deserti TaxID=1926257 RepID=A0ABV6QDW6_9ACTN